MAQHIGEIFLCFQAFYTSCSEYIVSANCLRFIYSLSRTLNVLSLSTRRAGNVSRTLKPIKLVLIANVDATASCKEIQFVNDNAHKSQN